MKTKIYLCLTMCVFTVNMFAQTVIPGGWITNGPVYSVSQNSQSTFVGGYFDLVGKHRPDGVLFNSNTGEPLTPSGFPDDLVSSSSSDGLGGFFIAGTTLAGNNSPSFKHVG